MKRLLIIIFLLHLFSFVYAQYKVRFVLKEKTAIHNDSIYITGTFNNWDSTANPKYLLKPYGANEKSIVLDFKAGPIKYKFHRGNWFTVEKQYYGREVSDRNCTVKKDITLVDSVSAWRDQLLSDKQYAFAKEKSDTTRVSILVAIANIYAFWPEYYNSDSALYYAQKAIQLQQKLISANPYISKAKDVFATQIIRLQELLATLFHSLGNYPKALEIRFENLNLAEQAKDKYIMVDALKNISYDYQSMKDYQNMLKYGKLSDSILNTLDTSEVRFRDEKAGAYWIIATAYYNLKLYDYALVCAKKMTDIQILKSDPFYLTYSGLLLADIYSAKGNISPSFYFYRQVISNALKTYSVIPYASAHAGIARLYQKEQKLDSALYYARQSVGIFQRYKIDVQAWGENSIYFIADIYPLLADIYKDNNQLDSAYKYLHLSVTLKDSLYNTDKIRQFQASTFNEASRRQQIEQQSRDAKQQYDTRVKMYGLITGLIVFLTLALILFRNNKHKQKANTILQSQKQEIEDTLIELKATQKQLIQSEKMASLGELTAGIAHEIQNPLNFVNNFSEVNTELIDELQQEMDKGNLAEASTISNDIKENEQKINHHGKRADAIVKGMLQHSRNNNGVKEPTDINALADEYLRLAYHGLRAKDKSFNATMKTDFDKTVGTVNIIPQDIGRVILNLITNAFYAVAEKKHQHPEVYEPTVSVSTKRLNGNVEIKVSDNGSGIPQNVLDKIFQPFFTTKPSGQGTGLGLSMSYDIIKVHGGELKVETKESEGSTFTIQLLV